MREWRLIIGSILLCLGAACGDGNNTPEDTVPEWDCSDDVPSFDDVRAFPEVCEHCHSSVLDPSRRRGAPVGLNFDDYDSASENAERIATEVYWGKMPPSGSGYTLTIEQQDTLFEWALCGAPE